MHDWADIPEPVFHGSPDSPHPDQTDQSHEEDPSVHDQPQPVHDPDQPVHDPDPIVHTTDEGKPLSITGTWSNKELAILQKAYLEDHMNYQQIAKLLPGRNPLSIKTKVYRMKWNRLRAKILLASKCLLQTNHPEVDKLAIPRRRLLSGQDFLEAAAAGAQAATERALDFALTAYRPQDLKAALDAADRGIRIYRASMGLDPDLNPGDSENSGGVLSMGQGAPIPVRGSARTV